MKNIYKKMQNELFMNVHPRQQQQQVLLRGKPRGYFYSEGNRSQAALTHPDVVKLTKNGRVNKFFPSQMLLINYLLSFGRIATTTTSTINNTCT